jgi:hypothetical protein
MPRSCSVRSQEVGHKRSMGTNHRGAELIGVDWELSSSIGLTGSTRGPRQSFETARRDLGMPTTAALELAGARVSVARRTQTVWGRLGNLGFVSGGGTPFYRERRSTAFIGSVESLAVDRSIPSTPPSCLRARGRRRPKGYAGLGHLWAVTAGLRPCGGGQVSPPPYFFLVIFLFPVFWIILTNIWFLFLQEFELRFILNKFRYSEVQIDV